MLAKDDEQDVAKFIVTREEWQARPLPDRIIDRLTEIRIEVNCIVDEIAGDDLNPSRWLQEQLDRIYSIAEAAQREIARGTYPSSWVIQHLSDIIVTVDAIQERIRPVDEPAEPDRKLAQHVRHIAQAMRARALLVLRKWRRSLRAWCGRP